tara:strand:+ start:25036 stop:25923 length:888 start_codon:yes stop_codon:yes gene_type:complete
MDLNTKETISILMKKLDGWAEGLIKIIPNFIAALVVLIIFVLLAKITKNIVSKVSNRLLKNSRALKNLLTSISFIFVLLIGLFISLEILNLEKTVTSLLAGAGVIGLALGFAFQEIASNFVSGILIALREPYKVGDIVQLEDYFGEVNAINLRTTNIRTFDGLEVLIPNKYLFTKPFINFTTTPERRLDIKVGVSYGDDLSKVEGIITDALADLEDRIEGKEIEVFYDEFGSSSINLTTRVWVNYPKNQAFLKAKHKAIICIKKAFDENGITIPFPIRTLDFDIKGGGPLKDQIK